VRTRGHGVLFGLALVLLVALSLWWTVLIRGSVRAEREAALREVALMALIAGERGDDFDRAGEERRIDERYGRRTVMVWGEGALLFVLVGVCFVMLARMIRQERREMAAMESFISTVTHEMKSPLAGIRSLLETAAAGGLPEDKRAEIMGMGIAEADRLEHMIENVLVAGRLRADRHPLELVLATPAGVLDPFVDHRRGLLGDVSVSYGDGGRDAQMLVDPGSLRIVLDNLVDNAVKYGRGDPEVRIEVVVEGRSIRIDVKDRGEGFDPADAEELFTPFRRASAQGATGRHGTGLGLSIARTLVRRMGGELTAASEGRGRGACFTVRIPGRPE